MIQVYRSLFLFGLCYLNLFSLGSCISKETNQKSSLQEEVSLPSLELERIKESVWKHKSFGIVNGNIMPSNGLVVVTSRGIVLIDTAWGLEQTIELEKLIQEKFKKEILFVVISHSHEDRSGGVPLFLKKGIPVYTSSRTGKLLSAKSMTGLRAVLDIQPRIPAGDQTVEVYFPGEGHTSDNIVVWLPDTHILFGGCLVRPLDAKDMGNTKDANLGEWENSVKKVLARYPDAEVVVPGHGDWGKLDLLRHTIRLLVPANH
ncbi:subclass B1 metallo-beta-lactamase [Leptospira brenneri]|uniref:beta-lactamase n=1 Tax=Leptospira brenneri TaxID=2023182 RepID=A0A2M9Y030_9LEPT|nr:subclass B1 metallo-beta-lactamase [Leptospira brenneri]PJZ44756.1 subclass B1 metallo-beta-lactamase [Leptospira brenneri]TGK96999.1 subclass B1 metallo-beta-lactamase [Leptospira brenneri]